MITPTPPLFPRLAAFFLALIIASGSHLWAEGFTRLVLLPPPRIVASAPADNGRGPAGSLLDGNPSTEFISLGAGKNWFSIDRWADVSNSDFGVTWVSLDTPLVQVGGLTANLLNSQTNPDVWRKHVGPTQKLYAWAMNNHWGTNYRASQEGPVTFRFVLRPHGAYDPAAASRLAIGASQPLLAVRAHGAPPSSSPRLRLDSPDIIVTGIKPSDDGKAVIVRLWDASGRDGQTRLQWSAPVPRQVWLSDTSEAPLHPVGESVALAAWGVATVRAEMP